MKKVTNISKDRHLLFDKGGKRIELNPGESILMIHYPEDAFPFKVEDIEKTEELEEKKLKGGKK